VTGLLQTLLKVFGVYKIYEKYLEHQISKKEKPKHIGLILDGNRRWAREKSLPTKLGHYFGAENAKNLLEWCYKLGIESVTVFAFSTENFNRPKEEVDELFAIMEEKLRELLQDERIHKYRVRVKGIGKMDLLPQSIRSLLSDIERNTADYDQHFLNIALAYGGRSEIVDAVKKICEEVKAGRLDPSTISAETIERHLYTSHLPHPDPDLIIRTSGEERLSGFLLWQSAYSELVFLDIFWPEFRKIDLMRAIRIYQQRDRRFGR
jgi:tritrans,polycis-undecaprenyl-diphosphate synthase [geranylgeranyl-diphosphate specific]